MEGLSASQVIEWERVLQARADAGDTRAAKALATHPLRSPAWMEDRGPAAFPCPISDWCQTWPLGGWERGAGESVGEWAMRCLKGMGMDTLEAAAWLREVDGRG